MLQFMIFYEVDMSEAKQASGGNNNYWLVVIKNPKRLEPYTAECEDIIEALGMNFAEGCAFKAIWRSCAARSLGKLKPGLKEDGIYDAEKAVYYAQRMVAQRKSAQLAEVKVNSSLPPTSSNHIATVMRRSLLAAGFQLPGSDKR